MIMKNFKFLYLLLAVVGVVTFTSCTEEWTPGPKDTNAGVYFPSTSVITVTEDATYDIVVKRTNTNGDLTVSVRSEVAENSVDFLSVATSVSFADGEDTALLAVTVTGSADMEKSKKYSALVKLEGAHASTYGVSEATFSFMLPEPWVDYVDESGKIIYGTYVDDFWPIFLEYDPGYSVPVRIQKHESDPNLYRVVEPFGKQFFKYMFGDTPGFFTLEEGVSIEFDATNPADVKLVGNPAYLGVICNFGADGMLPMYMLVSDEPGTITLEDGVFRFAKDKVFVELFYQGSFFGGFEYANTTGLMAYALPGVPVTDYKVTVEYAGMYVAADNSSASAVLNFGAGADVESIMYTVVEGDVSNDFADVVASVVDGSASPLVQITENEQLTQEIELTRGTWTVVAVPYGADGAVEGKAVAYPFWFNGVGEIPQVEVEVRFGSMLELTGEEGEFSSDYWAGIAVVANGDDIKSIKAFVNTLASVEASGMSYEAILAGYGQDFSADIEELKANGAAIVGPFNVPLETEVIALVAVETIYGETKIFAETCTTTNSTGIKFGEYTIAEGDYTSVIAIFGGYEAGQAYFVIDGTFEMEGSYDATARTITTPGIEEQYAKGDLICNDIYFYYNQEKTQAYGYWAAADAEYTEACDLTFGYGEDGAVNALMCYFAKHVFDLSTKTLAFSEYAFTPAATVVKYEAAAPAAKAALASAKSATSNAKVANVAVKSNDRIWIPAM